MYILNNEKNELKKIPETMFLENDIKERNNIEEWIRKDSSILGEELLIIAHEYDKFEVNERLDLLALDKEGNLVIIEVKRDRTGGNVDFQAMKYCSYCSTFKPNQIIEMYEEYNKKFNIKEDAIESIMNFLDIDSEDLLNEVLNNGQRIIIVGKEIDKRILSVCAWLSQNNINIKCMTIIPYKLNESDEIIVDINQLIPAYSIEEYYINKKKIEKSKGRIVQPDYVIEFFNDINSALMKKGYRTYYSNRKSYMSVKTEYSRNLYFVLGIKKRDSLINIELTANNRKVSKKLSEIYVKNKAEIEGLLNYSCELSEGSKNTDWLRLYHTFPYDKKKDLESYSELICSEFLKFINALQKFLI
jgi:hypothetical protein